MLKLGDEKAIFWGIYHCDDGIKYEAYSEALARYGMIRLAD